MAVAVKENVNPDVMLEDPEEIMEEPAPRSETPREGEDATARATRDLRDKLARDILTLENEKKKKHEDQGWSLFFFKRSTKEAVI